MLYGMRCQKTLLLENFESLMCMPIIFLGLGTSTHVCSQSIPDCYIIKRHVSHAWYGCWTIKALVEAEV
jgi:hypothetical protein